MKLKQATLILISVVLIAGCILLAGCTSQNISSDNTSKDTTKSIVGTWVHMFTNPNGEESTHTYQFNADYTGTFTTYSKSVGTGTSGLHWLYDEKEKAFLVNYDKLGQQEYMATTTDEEGIQYLVSLGGGYICTKL